MFGNNFLYLVSRCEAADMRKHWKAFSFILSVESGKFNEDENKSSSLRRYIYGVGLLLILILGFTRTLLIK